MLNRLVESLGLKKFIDGFHKERASKQVVVEDFFKDKNWELWGDDYAALYRMCLSPGSEGVFQLTNLENNQENNLNFIANYLNYIVRESMPSALDHKAEIAWSDFVQLNPTRVMFDEEMLNVMLHGEKANELNTPELETFSLSRHLSRSVSLMKILLERIFIVEQINLDDESKLHELGTKYFGGVHPFHLLISAYLHDYARHINQTSEHDNLLDSLIEKAGLPPEIVKTIYVIQPTNHVVRDADGFDNSAQKLVRIADLFAKVIPRSRRNYKYLTTVHEVIERATRNQRKYFEAERHDNTHPNSLWFRKDEIDFQKYMANERILLESAVNWFEKVTGDTISNLFQTINDFPEYFELADQTFIPNERG